jgi:hypothetical protein
MITLDIAKRTQLTEVNVNNWEDLISEDSWCWRLI